MENNNEQKPQTKRKIHFLHWDHVGVSLMAALVAAVLGLVSLNLSMFNPVQRAFEDFSMTDVYYEMQRGGATELNNDIILVDMTELRDRSEIGLAIQQIGECQPRVLSVDLLFPKEGDDVMANAALVSAIDELQVPVVFSSKLVDYDPKSGAFQRRITSFFSQYGDYTWAYGNVLQQKVGGVIRQYTLSQQLEDQPVWSLAYQTACLYTGEKPQKHAVNERLIVYGDTDFPVVNCKDIKEHARLLKDKIVVLGTISDEEDSHITPVGKMAGMKVQAYSMLSYIQNRDLRQMSNTQSLLLAFLLCYLSAWIGYWIPRLFKRTGGYVLSIFYFVLAAALVWVSFLCFIHQSYNISLLYPLLGIAFVEKGRSYYSDLVNLLHRKFKWKLLKHSLYLEQAKGIDTDDIFLFKFWRRRWSRRAFQR
jgi:CHASE2 domain-containing sensor protein